ncbi:MAG: phasin family protein [Alphaproteobacteria bacterium]
MTKSAKTAPAHEAAPLFPQTEVAAFNGDLFSAYAKASQAFLESTAALNQEVARFVNERLQAHAQALRVLPNCTSWEDAVAVHSDLARSAADAYSAEVPKLTEQAAKNCTALYGPLFETAKTFPQVMAKS